MNVSLKFLIFLLFTSFNIFSQQFVFKTTSFLVAEKNNKGKWSEWSKPKKSEMIIKVDGEHHRIVVYSQDIQLFSIVKYNEVKKTKTDIISSFNCVDNTGVECVVSIFTRKNQNNRRQLYITYDDMIIEYNIEIKSN
ncbi:MAG TPA: hypothetical protein DDZ41_10075 [Flavobacterium sp.]|nr:hypothetical protein [Flavobacterium sp.]